MRPPIPYDPGPAFEWFASVRDSLDWSTDPDLLEGRLCRFRPCREPAVAVLDRSRRRGRRLWYGYCDEHLYGRWIEDGKVVGWRLRPRATT